MMRARNRHSASNYLFAAFLELVIMTIFVIIAQPQLRKALFELLEPPSQAIAAPAPAAVGSTSFVNDTRYGADDLPALGAAGRVASSGPLSMPLEGSAAEPQAGLRLRAQPIGWSTRGSGSAPFEQFESFAVSSSGAAMPASPASVALEKSVGPEKRVAGYAPSPGATQLEAIDWNIAAAGGSPRPLSGWTASRPAEADYRDTYPPPYGTQSQWK